MTGQGDHRLGEFGVSAKVEIKTEVPSATTGRMVDAITDFLSPISQSLGYLGDKIQLQRQKTLFEICQRAKERIAISQKSIRPIPQKFFLPLLEKASLEEVNDETLVDMWSNLIATASTEEVEMLGQYINILSNIVPKQVNILAKMLDNIDCKAGHLVDNYYYLNQTGLPATLSEHSRIVDAEQFADAIVASLNIKGVAIDTINIFYTDHTLGQGFSLGSPDGIYSDEQFLHFENLVRLGLIDRTEIKSHKIGIFDIDVHYYVVNPVGIDLFACCNPTKLNRTY
jgi:Abortive infection alpha